MFKSKLFAIFIIIAMGAVTSRLYADTTPDPKGANLPDDISVSDLEELKSKLSLQLSSIDQLIAGLQYITAPTKKPLDDTIVKALIPDAATTANKAKLDDARNAVRNELSGRAGYLIGQSLQKSPTVDDSMTTLSRSSLETATIIATLRRSLEGTELSVPKECQSPIVSTDGVSELTDKISTCLKATKDIIEADNIQQRVRQAVDIAQTGLQGLRDKFSKNLLDVENKLAAARKVQIKNVDISQTAVTYTVPIIGLLMLLFLMAPRLYPGETQMAIINNSLLLELLTVYLLIATILLLGLSAKIDANILGTLLGGISGYVLGRNLQKKAAQESSKDGTEPPKPKAVDDAGFGLGIAPEKPVRGK